MQQQPTADEVNSRTAECQHQLSEQNQPDEADILILDTDIYYGLRKEWQGKLQETTDNQAQDDLPEILAVFLHMPKKKPKRPLLFDGLIALHLICKECRSSFQKHCNALVFAIRFRAYPMLLELI